ncbi:MAG TPA: TadE/TadG family type IV pilus assembly protein [Planctomycetaceae bacterium]|jgi:Flp pilus assembly protein TadG|nr:TadE/TadG family type IV pilus assembly protein [Planctomycetaceae bacterium]
MRRNRTTEFPRLGTSAKWAASGRTFARRSATACVEFAVVLPILLTFVLGVLEVGRFIQVYEILNAAAREGARQASTGQMTNAQVIAAVTGCVQASGLPTAKLNVTVQDLTNAGTDVSQATILDNLQVTVSLPYNAVEWITTSYFLNSTSQISTTVYWVSTNPQSYPSGVTAPTGS